MPNETPFLGAAKFLSSKPEILIFIEADHEGRVVHQAEIPKNQETECQKNGKEAHTPGTAHNSFRRNENVCFFIAEDHSMGIIPDRNKIDHQLAERQIAQLILQCPNPPENQQTALLW